MKYNREEIMERLFLSVVEKDGNEELLSNVPHDLQGEYAVMPRFFYGDKNEYGQYEQSAAVSNEMLLGLECDIDTILSVARENSRNNMPGKIEDLSKHLEDEHDLAAYFDDLAIPKAFALTNRDQCDGLSVLFYHPELVEDLSSLIEKNVLLFPVDKDVLICVGVKNNDDVEKLTASFKEAGEKLASAGDRLLSDNPIHYDRDHHSFRVVGGKELAMDGYGGSSAQQQSVRSVSHHR